MTDIIGKMTHLVEGRSPFGLKTASGTIYWITPGECSTSPDQNLMLVFQANVRRNDQHLSDVISVMVFHLDGRPRLATRNNAGETLVLTSSIVEIV